MTIRPGWPQPTSPTACPRRAAGAVLGAAVLTALAGSASAQPDDTSPPPSVPRAPSGDADPERAELEGVSFRGAVGGAADEAADPAGRAVPILGDRLSGFVLPIEPIDGDIVLESLRASAWTVDDTKRLVLEQDVTVRIGPYAYAASRAVVWINRLPHDLPAVTGATDAPRRPANQVAVWFEDLAGSSRPTGVGLAGSDLLVTASTFGSVSLESAVLDRGRPRRSAVLTRAENRLAARLRRLVDDRAPEALSRRPEVRRGEDLPPDPDLPREVVLPDDPEERTWLSRPGAVIAFAADRVRFESGADENVVTATGDFVVEYYTDDRRSEPSQLTLRADRAVIFTEPGTIEELADRDLDVSAVRGIYLEGDVSATADRGARIVRSPRVYYDFRRDRAIMLDAVLRTTLRDGEVPVIARAREMRQVARDEFVATRARASTSEYRVGHVSLGAKRLTLTRRPEDPADPEGPRETFVQAESITLNAGRTPIFWWPGFSGTGENLPIRGIRGSYSNTDGAGIETRWDVLGLTGLQPEAIDEVTLSLDFFSRRGPATGVEAAYAGDGVQGRIDTYVVDDDGEDRTPAGRTVDQDGGLRGLALLEHRWRLGPNTRLDTQVSYISDPSFIAGWRPEDYRERREYETSAYLRHVKDREAITLVGSYQLNDFLSNSYLLASTGYTVERQPEVAWRRYGDPWFGGAVTYTGETRAGRMRLFLEPSTPRELGIRERAYGIDRDDPIDELLRAQGLDSRFVARADSRHEIQVPFDVGAVRVVPFAVGRATIYDDDFEEYGGETDAARLYGSVGVRATTRFQTIDDTVESRLLDLERLRTIIEPGVTLWYAESDLASSNLMPYDPEVEGIVEGAAVRFGLKGRVQTWRGGPEGRRMTDVLEVDADLVLAGDDADRDSPVPQWVEFRPEYAELADHGRVRGRWAVSDALRFVGEATVDLDGVLARGSVGFDLRHSPVLSSYVEYRTLDASSSELLQVRWDYRLSPRYRVALTPAWDFKRSEFRSVRLQVVRSFPDFNLFVRVEQDEIRDETTLGASIGLVRF